MKNQSEAEEVSERKKVERDGRKRGKQTEYLISMTIFLRTQKPLQYPLDYHAYQPGIDFFFLVYCVLSI